jgi:peptidoglycan/LPS O-acetylase OafA/YrhL
LDSLRGLAALAVVFHHFLYILPGFAEKTAPGVLGLLSRSPLRLFFAGHEAVVFFFVLSGFVLALPFLRRPQPYGQYVVKRVARIWIPYAFAVSVAFLCFWAFGGGPLEGLSTWVNSTWTTPPGTRAVLEHYTLITSFENGAYDPVLWSLVHEMRVSLVFPLLVWVVLRWDWKAALGVGFVAYVVGRLGGHQPLPFLGETDYFRTFSYLYMFILGALLAKHRFSLESLLYHRRPGWVRRAALATAVLLYIYRYMWPGMPRWLVSLALDVPTALGVAVIIVYAGASARASRLLNASGLVYLGKISYSLYLLHAVVLLSVLHLAHEHLPIWAIWLVALTSATMAASLSYQFVERPAMALGRWVAGQFGDRAGGA